MKIGSQALEWLKQLGLPAFGNSWTRISNFQAEPVIWQLIAGKNYGASFTIELDGIRQQIKQHLLEFLAVCQHIPIAADGHVRINTYIPFFSQWPDQIDCFLQRLPHTYRLGR